MTTVKVFFTEREAMRFIDQDQRENLFIQKELDGYYHVYDGDE